MKLKQHSLLSSFLGTVVQTDIKFPVPWVLWHKLMVESVRITVAQIHNKKFLLIGSVALVENEKLFHRYGGTS